MIILLLSFGIYKQIEFKKLKKQIENLQSENKDYQSDLSDTEDELQTVHDKLGDLISSIYFKRNPKRKPAVNAKLTEGLSFATARTNGCPYKSSSPFTLSISAPPPIYNSRTILWFEQKFGCKKRVIKLKKEFFSYSSLKKLRPLTKSPGPEDTNNGRAFHTLQI